MDFLFIKKCTDFTHEHYREAAKNRKNTYLFLAHFIKICKPHECEEQMLAFFGEVAKVARAFNQVKKTMLQAEDYFWLDGHLQIKIQACDMFSCRIKLFSGKGGIYEAMKQFQMLASYFEFKNCVQSHSLIHPLKIVSSTDSAILLEVDTEAPRSTASYFDMLRPKTQASNVESAEIPAYPTISPPDDDNFNPDALPKPPVDRPPPSDLMHALIEPKSQEATNAPQELASAVIVPLPKPTTGAPPKHTTSAQVRKRTNRPTKTPATKPPSEAELDAAWNIFNEIEPPEEATPPSIDLSETFPNEEPPSTLQFAILPRPKKK